jgi:hypothetical protein
VLFPEPAYTLHALLPPFTCSVVAPRCPLWTMLPALPLGASNYKTAAQQQISPGTDIDTLIWRRQSAYVSCITAGTSRHLPRATSRVPSVQLAHSSSSASAAPSTKSTRHGRCALNTHLNYSYTHNCNRHAQCWFCVTLPICTTYTYGCSTRSARRTKSRLRPSAPATTSAGLGLKALPGHLLLSRAQQLCRSM